MSWSKGAFWADVKDYAGVFNHVTNANLREAASWRLGAELVRRYPEDLLILLSWPIAGGGYDCLRVIRLDGSGYIDINRKSSGSASRSIAGSDPEDSLWIGMLSEWISVSDRVGMIRGVSRWMDMPEAKSVPRTSKRTLAYRAIAAFLADHALDKESWRVEAVMRIGDAGDAVIDAELASLTGLETEVLSSIDPSELPDLDAAGAFVLLRDEEPVATIFSDATGLTQQTDLSLDLMATYELEGNVSSIAAALTHLLLAEGDVIDPTMYRIEPRPVTPTPAGAAHHWVMSAVARLSQAEAEGFAELSGRADTPLAVIPGEVRCARCDESPASASDTCPGFLGEPFAHHWSGILKLSLSEDETQAWSTRGDFPELSPQGVGLYCTLCGLEWSVAEPKCREQRFLFGSSGV
jgi:hypothetical protein